LVKKPLTSSVKLCIICNIKLIKEVEKGELSMWDNYVVIAEWFDEVEGVWKPVISKRPVVLKRKNG